MLNIVKTVGYSALTVLLVCVGVSPTLAQGAGIMERSGKFPVVIVLIVAIFVGILVFLFILERKLSSLERKIEE